MGLLSISTLPFQNNDVLSPSKATTVEVSAVCFSFSYFQSKTKPNYSLSLNPSEKSTVTAPKGYFSLRAHSRYSRNTCLGKTRDFPKDTHEKNEEAGDKAQ